MAELPGASVDSVVTDPPYHFASIIKRYGQTDIRGSGTNEARARAGSDQFIRASRGFMGKSWDGGDIAFRPATWTAALRVLKPGGYLVAFGAPKNVHRLACAIEDAGFELRDTIMWLFGTGFPKSKNIGGGFGTALKPAYEPIILARKPLDGTVAENVIAHGTGALNIDGCRVETADKLAGSGTPPLQYGGANHRPFHDRAEPRGINQSPLGRWPANVVHDGSEEVVAAFPQSGPSSDAPRNNGDFKSTAKGHDRAHISFGHADAGGSAARFFYSAKADSDDRIGSKHPTVKPIDLMRWLCRLVTPSGGTILDPFAGTGTTGEAAFYEGFNAVLIEREPEYQVDIARRMSLVLAGKSERKRAILAEKSKTNSASDDGPLFGGST